MSNTDLHQSLPSDSVLSPTDWHYVLLRLVIALLVGAMVGWEREMKNKPAGLRTHMLVSLGAAITVITGIQTGAAQASADVLSRVIQGIVTGVGFLGAGEIFQKVQSSQNRIRIRGLTSAAAIWVSASLGIASGSGLWQVALMGASLVLLVLWGLKKFEHRINSGSRRTKPED